MTRTCSAIFGAFADAGATINGIEVSTISSGLAAFRNIDYYLLRGRPWEEDISVRNFLLQLYSLERVSELWWPHRNAYDAIIYMRPDMDFFTKLKAPFPLKNNTLYAPDFHEWWGTNDRFAIGVPRVMEVYGHRFRYYEEWNRGTKWPTGKEENIYPFVFHAETYLKSVMEMFGFKHEPLKGFRFGRVRANGELHYMDQSLVEENG